MHHQEEKSYRQWGTAKTINWRTFNFQTKPPVQFKIINNIPSHTSETMTWLQYITKMLRCKCRSFITYSQKTISSLYSPSGLCWSFSKANILRDGNAYMKFGPPYASLSGILESSNWTISMSKSSPSYEQSKTKERSSPPCKEGCLEHGLRSEEHS